MAQSKICEYKNKLSQIQSSFEKLICKICDKNWIDSSPMAIDCDHKYCEKCIRSYIATSFEKSGLPIPCPTCRRPLSRWNRYYPNAKDRELVARYARICNRLDEVPLFSQVASSSNCEGVLFVSPAKTDSIQSEENQIPKSSPVPPMGSTQDPYAGCRDSPPYQRIYDESSSDFDEDLFKKPPGSKPTASNRQEELCQSSDFTEVLTQMPVGPSKALTPVQPLKERTQPQSEPSSPSQDISYDKNIIGKVVDEIPSFSPRASLRREPAHIMSHQGTGRVTEYYIRWTNGDVTSVPASAAEKLCPEQLLEYRRLAKRNNSKAYRERCKKPKSD